MILFNIIMLLSGKSPKPASDKFFTRKLMNLLSLIKHSEPKFVEDNSFNIQDLQWNLCEFDKYERIRNGERGRKRRYP